MKKFAYIFFELNERIHIKPKNIRPIPVSALALIKYSYISNSNRSPSETYYNRLDLTSPRQAVHFPAPFCSKNK